LNITFTAFSPYGITNLWSKIDNFALVPLNYIEAESMAKYSKPKIKVKKIKLNLFLANDSLKSPLGNFNNNRYVAYIEPPSTGSAGLKIKD